MILQCKQPQKYPQPVGFFILNKSIFPILVQSFPTSSSTYSIYFLFNSGSILRNFPEISHTSKNLLPSLFHNPRKTPRFPWELWIHTTHHIIHTIFYSPTSQIFNVLFLALTYFLFIFTCIEYLYQSEGSFTSSSFAAHSKNFLIFSSDSQKFLGMN